MSVDQRRPHRYPRLLSVELAGAQPHTTHLSVGGMQVEMPAMRCAGLRGGLGATPPERPIQLPGQPVPLIVSGEIRYADLVEDAYLAGVAFGQWHAYGADRWREHVETIDRSFCSAD
jgi:hypothetical protein